jgi:hypothetical protein
MVYANIILYGKTDIYHHTMAFDLHGRKMRWIPRNPRESAGGNGILGSGRNWE